jgi:lysophospholipase L1-like esterase
MQIRLATELNLAFWDWQAAMGGPCSSTAWVAQGLQRGDYIHFNLSGGNLLGQSLAKDLEEAQAKLSEK